MTKSDDDMVNELAQSFNDHNKQLKAKREAAEKAAKTLEQQKIADAKFVAENSQKSYEQLRQLLANTLDSIVGSNPELVGKIYIQTEESSFTVVNDENDQTVAVKFMGSSTESQSPLLELYSGKAAAKPIGALSCYAREGVISWSVISSGRIIGDYKAIARLLMGWLLKGDARL